MTRLRPTRRPGSCIRSFSLRMWSAATSEHLQRFCAPRERRRGRCAARGRRLPTWGHKLSKDGFFLSIVWVSRGSDEKRA